MNGCGPVFTARAKARPGRRSPGKFIAADHLSSFSAAFTIATMPAWTACGSECHAATMA